MHLAVFCPRCAGKLETRTPADDTRPRRVCSGCGFVLYHNHKLAAGTLPVRDGKVALIRRRFDPGRGAWSWPCGYVEVDESVEQGAARETAEECGLHVELRDLLGIYSYPIDPEVGATATSGAVILAWRADVIGGDLLAGDDADDARWYDLDDLPWEQLAFRSSHAALRDLLAVLGTRPETPAAPVRGAGAG